MCTRPICDGHLLRYQSLECVRPLIHRLPPGLRLESLNPMVTLADGQAQLAVCFVGAALAQLVVASLSAALVQLAEAPPVVLHNKLMGISCCSVCGGIYCCSSDSAGESTRAII